MLPEVNQTGPTPSARLKSALRERARALGFQLFGVAPAQPLEEDLARMRAWLDRGDGAHMARYLGRRPEERFTPRLLLDGARSVVVAGASYAQEPPDLSRLSGRPEGRIARYALGRDYHDVLGPRLEELAEWLGEAAAAASRCFVDTGPLAERAFARRAGLGFIGKNNTLIHPRHGSWFLLGALVTTAELPPDSPVQSKCGNCRLCIDACPAGALREPFRLDARRCLSCLTVETRRELDRQSASRLGDRLFGCDLCQEACPFNASPLACEDPALRPAEAPAGIDGGNATLARLLAIGSNRHFDRLLSSSPMRRARLKGMRRNARTVAANLGRTDLAPAAEAPAAEGS